VSAPEIASVIEVLTNGRYRLELASGRQVEGTVPASSQALVTRIRVGDSMTVEVSPFDRGKVRILGPAARERDE
jgi:translation initiation factor IF-1